MKQVTIDIESLASPSYDSFDDMLRYYTSGDGRQYVQDGLTIEEVVDDIRHVLRRIADEIEERERRHV